MKTLLLLSFALLQSAISHSQSDQQNNIHDFDFWIGTWDVYKYGTDTIVGHSEIKPILNHKTIEENYHSTVYPYNGTSNNIYNRQKDRWEQYWVDNGGLALHITGGLVDNSMVLSNCDSLNCNQIKWTPLQNGDVRQEWSQSNNKGETWTKVFDGLYKSKVKNDKPRVAIPSLSHYPNNRDFTISANGTEAYITLQNPTEEVRVICKLTQSHGQWSDPIPASFSGHDKDIEPFLSPDNLRLYFASDRSNGTEKPDYDIYYVERDHLNSAWSAPINVGSPINTAGDEFYPAIANNGNMYFTSTGEGTKGKDDIFFSKHTVKGYEPPISLSDNINTEGYEFNSYVSPVESYLIFSGYNREDGLGSGDLYISTKNESNEWSQAVNMGEKINSKYMDYCPYVDTKNGILYFTSRRHQSVDEPIKTNFHLKQAILQPQNGDSKVYQTKIKF